MIPKILFRCSKDGQLEDVCEVLKHIIKALKPSLTLKQTLNSNGDLALSWSDSASSRDIDGVSRDGVSRDGVSRDMEGVSVDLELGLGTSVQFSSSESMSLQCDPASAENMSFSSQQEPAESSTCPIEYIARVSSPEDWDKQTRLKATLTVEICPPVTQVIPEAATTVEPVSAWNAPTELTGLVAEDLSDWHQHRAKREDGAKSGESEEDELKSSESEEEELMEGINEETVSGGGYAKEIAEITEEVEKLRVAAKRSDEEERKMSLEEQRKEEYANQQEIQRRRRVEMKREEDRRRRMPLIELLTTERDAMKSARPEDINYAANNQLKKKLNTTAIA